jgi:hypothetical protein
MRIQKRDKEIVPIHIANGVSSSLTIPIQIARKFGIDKPTYVTVEGTKEGILIKPMEIAP